MLINVLKSRYHKTLNVILFFRDLYEWEDTRELAISNYKEHAPEMMHATRQGVARDIHVIMD